MTSTGAFAPNSCSDGLYARKTQSISNWQWAAKQCALVLLNVRHGFTTFCCRRPHLLRRCF
jgi:hypothetical protein